MFTRRPCCCPPPCDLATGELVSCGLPTDVQVEVNIVNGSCTDCDTVSGLHVLSHHPAAHSPCHWGILDPAQPCGVTSTALTVIFSSVDPGRVDVRYGVVAGGTYVQWMGKASSCADLVAGLECTLLTEGFPQCNAGSPTAMVWVTF